MGSSYLTFAGLAHQGELNVDVMDHDACNKLVKWFEDRWTDRLCIDISKEIAEIIGQSWAREQPIPSYHIYIKMAYHLSQEAREEIIQHHIPRDFRDSSLNFRRQRLKSQPTTFIGAEEFFLETLSASVKRLWLPRSRGSFQMTYCWKL